MEIQDVRHDFPKNAGYTLIRPDGRNYYIFAHYLSPVTLTLGQTTYECKTGDCVLLTPNIAHNLFSKGPLIHNWLHICTADEKLEEMFDLPVNVPFSPGNHDQISEKVRRIEAEFFSKEPYREQLLDAYVTEFFIWLHRSYKNPTALLSVPKSLEVNIVGLRRRILSHPEKNYTIAQLADMLALSTSRFHAVYKIMFGTTPYQDMVCAKVDRAKVLLLSNPEMTLKHVAEKLGYTDQYHFIRQFKMVVGLTPGQYRKKHEKEQIIR